MNRDRSREVKDHFAACARDLTPSASRDAVRVLYAPASADPQVTALCESVLSHHELLRAARFTRDEDRRLFRQRRAFRRFCGALALGRPRSLARVEFEETAKGRPWLPGLAGFCFSFSSCRSGFLGAWSPGPGIGVDLEDHAGKLDTLELARLYFSDAEARVVERAGETERRRIFFQFWNLKEAALKSIGEGLPFGMDSFEFELLPVPRMVRSPTGRGNPEDFRAHLIGGAGRHAALVIAAPSLAEWGEFMGGYSGSPAEAVDDDSGDLADCPDSTPWEAGTVHAVGAASAANFLFLYHSEKKGNRG